MSEQILILGDGQMALVLADAIDCRGFKARVWSPFADDAATLEQTRTSRRLSGFRLPHSIDVTAEDKAAFEGVSLIISAIPTQFLRSVWDRLAPHASGSHAAVVSVTKGVEVGTDLRPTQIIAQSLGFASDDPRVCVLSGPSIAAELAKRLPATLVAAAVDESLATRVQEALRVPWLRVYRSDDVLGVEMAGAAKNVIALAAGMVDGVEAGANAKSALLARGLAEIARLGVVMGARVETFFGVAGVGDLATTCFSPEGRNRTCGERLGRGEKLEAVLESMTSIVEGVPTTRSLMELSRTLDVEMPITAAVHAILFEGLSPKEAIRSLMEREPKAERIG